MADDLDFFQVRRVNTEGSFNTNAARDFTHGKFLFNTAFAASDNYSFKVLESFAAALNNLYADPYRVSR